MTYSIVRILSIILFLLFGIGFSQLPTELMFEQASVLSILLFSLPAFLGMILWLGEKKGLLAIISVSLFAMMIETIGIHTGFPYSEFTYVLPVGGKLFGTTPWTVFFAWSPFVFGAFALAYYRFDRPLHVFFFSILSLIAFDLVLDPGAVARGLWAYTNGGSWYDVPFQNYLGWIFSSFIAIWLLTLITKKEVLTQKHLLLLSSSFFLSLSFWTGVAIGYQLALPAIIGISSMGIIYRNFFRKSMLQR